MPTSTTFTSLPTELRLKIYDYILTNSSISSFRPQRKIGWNRPHADLSNPALLFESDSHPALHALFHSKLTKNDHVLILTHLLRSTRVLVVDHIDFASLQRLCDAARLPSVAVGLSAAGRVFAGIVATELRNVDFGDRLDEVVCQPGDLVRLVNGLKGLQRVYLRSGHVARYSGSVEEHIEFARDRAVRELELGNARKREVGGESVESAADEFRRLNLRSPMTDGTRMMISPAIFAGSRLASAGGCGDRWVVVDLSMLVWQHYLYTGAPYKDHWRCVKMNTLLEVAEKNGLEVVMGFRYIEFDPSGSRGRSSGSTRRPLRERLSLRTGQFRAEMSTRDWVLRLKQRSFNGNSDVEFAVRQRRVFDKVASQEGCGLVRCWHARRGSVDVCESCATITRVTGS